MSVPAGRGLPLSFQSGCSLWNLIPEHGTPLPPSLPGCALQSVTAVLLCDSQQNIRSISHPLYLQLLAPLRDRTTLTKTDLKQLLSPDIPASRLVLPQTPSRAKRIRLWFPQVSERIEMHTVNCARINAYAPSPTIPHKTQS